MKVVHMNDIAQLEKDVQENKDYADKMPKPCEPGYYCPEAELQGTQLLCK